MSVIYCKYPKILYSSFSDKTSYANSADPDQTAPKGDVWSKFPVFAIPQSILLKQKY